MAVRSGEELLEKVKAVIGESTDDAAIELVEDVTDTLADYDAKVAESKASEWEAKYNEAVAEKERIDIEWRRKYTDRFFGTEDNGVDETELEVGDHTEDVEVKTTFEELFE